ncbi:hypothetical protein ACPPVU_02925 [Mucilaginibacter sp. McL0603]|uniref:hypothetical protein n=1 Tax=Mucilaginibacter sp. McL0603 TaxID=3415670 RepID=UPI003CE6D452
MNLITKLHLSSAFFMIVALNTYAQNTTKIDESNLVTQMLGIENISPAEANSYFINKKYNLVSRSNKDMGGYEAMLIKYKIPQATDSYCIIVVKDQITIAMYITYSNDLYLKTLNDALKMGFKKLEEANSDPAETVYEKGNEDFLVRTTRIQDKTFYVMEAYDVIRAGKAGLGAKGN